jgi:hypothetical protein
LVDNLLRNDHVKRRTGRCIFKFPPLSQLTGWADLTFIRL